MSDSKFKSKVYKLVSSIPKGKVMYYSQVAIYCDKPRAARAVGMIAHYGDESIPWHRIVNKKGETASGYWGGKRIHAEMLKAEGVEVDEYKIKDFKKYLWQPNQ